MSTLASPSNYTMNSSDYYTVKPNDYHTSRLFQYVHTFGKACLILFLFFALSEIYIRYDTYGDGSIQSIFFGPYCQNSTTCKVDVQSIAPFITLSDIYNHNLSNPDQDCRLTTQDSHFWETRVKNGSNVPCYYRQEYGETVLRVFCKTDVAYVVDVAQIIVIILYLFTLIFEYGIEMCTPQSSIE